MQISSKEVFFLISIITVIFLTVPIFLFAYIRLYNHRKKKHSEEKESLQQAFAHELLKTQMEVQEQTLKTVGYDLHDNIGQLLGLTVITLSSIDLDDRTKSAEKIKAAEELTKRSVKAIRALSRLLHGEELLSRGLTGAIEFELEWVEKSGLFTVTYGNRVKGMPQHADKEMIIFRLFQETLNNIIRHAQATAITINLDYTDNTLALSLEDNGIGFDPEATAKLNKGMGLHNIQKRAEMIGGYAVISSSLGQGTTTRITVPY